MIEQKIRMILAALCLTEIGIIIVSLIIFLIKLLSTRTLIILGILATVVTICSIIGYLIKNKKDIKKSKEFDKQILDRLDEIGSLEELNETQKYLRISMLTIFSNGSKEDYIRLDKEYDIKKTKELFYRWLEPIEQTFIEKILGTLGCIFGF